MILIRSVGIALAALCIHAEVHAQKFRPTNLVTETATLATEADIVLGQEEISFRDLENRIYRAVDLNRDGAISVQLNGTLVTSPATGCPLRLYRARTILTGSQGARIVNTVASDGSTPCGFEATRSSVVQIAAEQIEISGVKVESTGDYSTGVLLLAGSTPRSLQRIENVEIAVHGKYSAGIMLSQVSLTKKEMPTVGSASFLQVKALGSSSRGIDVQKGVVSLLKDSNIEVGDSGKGIYTLFARGLSIGRLERVNVLVSGKEGYSLGIHGYGIREIEGVQVVHLGSQGETFTLVGNGDPEAPKLSVNALTLTSNSSFSMPAMANQPLGRVSGVSLQSPGQLLIIAPEVDSITGVKADYLSVAVKKAGSLHDVRTKGLSISGNFEEVRSVSSRRIEVSNAVITNLSHVSVITDSALPLPSFGIVGSSIENLSDFTIDMVTLGGPLPKLGLYLSEDSLIGSLINGKITKQPGQNDQCSVLDGEVYYETGLTCVEGSGAPQG